MKKNYLTGLLISLGVALVTITLYLSGALQAMYESGIDWRFKFWRGGVDIPLVGKLGFKPDPTDPENLEVPERAMWNVNIVGISDTTLDALGEWPLARHYYARFLRAITPDEGFPGPESVLVDIMFLTNRELAAKSIFDLADQLKGKKKIISKKSLNEVRALYREDDNQLTEAIKALGIVSTDYPIYTRDFTVESGKEIDKKVVQELYGPIKKRLQYIKKTAIPNVVDETGTPPWTNFPYPPTPRILKTGQIPGIANIRISDATQTNRRMPLVFKWHNLTDNKTYYLPNIDLVAIATYLKIDYRKDIEIVMGEYIKLKNIQDRKIPADETYKDFRDIMFRPNPERTITIPIDEEGFMDINFVAGPKSFPTIPLEFFADKDKGEVAPLMQNRFLLLAMYYATGATTAEDAHASPFDKKHAGIEHHANAINTILTQDFLYHSPAWVNILAYLFAGLLLGFLIPRMKTFIGFAFFLGFSGLVVVISFLLFEYSNYITVLQSVLWETLFCFIGITVYRIVFEESNTKYIRQTFSKFVSKDVVNELLKDPDNLQLGGRKNEITVLFSDVRGFTSISERLQPEQLVNLLNEYLTEMSDIIIKTQGTIDKYIGDAIMAFWGAPLPMEDHAFRACLSSVRQLERLTELRQKWHDEYGEWLDIGIGLNTGPAVVGNMGSSHRMDYTLMGDTVNLGSRLEGSTKQYTVKIIISEGTYEQVKDKVIVRELDTVRVKGKHEPVIIYELLDIKEEYQAEILPVAAAAAT